MKAYRITPDDLTFFRDGRPLDGSIIGRGGRWPNPTIWFDAVHAAFHRAYPERETWEHGHRFGRSSDRDYERAPTQRFGSLATLAPYPSVGDCEQGMRPRWFFAAPADIVRDEGGGYHRSHPLLDKAGFSDLPDYLHPVADPTCAAKEPKVRPWWSKLAIEAYLEGGELMVDDRALRRHEDLFAGEFATGISINPDTQTQDGEGFFSAEDLRLAPEVNFGVAGTMPIKNGSTHDGLERVFDGDGKIVVMGGQQRICGVREIKQTRLGDLLPVSAPITGDRVKWTLLSHAIFPNIPEGETSIPHPGGWLPSWVEPANGTVMLRKGDTARRDGEPREAWRRRINDLPRFDCHLVAARIPKPVVVTGWSERKHLFESEGAKEARPSLLAVPAGAVYYFEGEDAPLLADALSWHGRIDRDSGEAPDKVVHRRSTLMGEKGLGIGVCGPWEPFPA